jgi:hypothetical protein
MPDLGGAIGASPGGGAANFRGCHAGCDCRARHARERLAPGSWPQRSCRLQAPSDAIQAFREEFQFSVESRRRHQPDREAVPRRRHETLMKTEDVPSLSCRTGWSRCHAEPVKVAAVAPAPSPPTTMQNRAVGQLTELMIQVRAIFRGSFTSCQCGKVEPAMSRRREQPTCRHRKQPGALGRPGDKRSASTSAAPCQSMPPPSPPQPGPSGRAPSRYLRRSQAPTGWADASRSQCALRTAHRAPSRLKHESRLSRPRRCGYQGEHGGAYCQVTGQGQESLPVGRARCPAGGAERTPVEVARVGREQQAPMSAAPTSRLFICTSEHWNQRAWATDLKLLCDMLGLHRSG